MKIKIFFIALLILITATYFSFKDDDSWKSNKNIRKEVTNKDFPNLNGKEFLLNNLQNVNYMAIVYPREIRTSHNSWAHRVGGLSTKEAYSTVKADVEFTVYGKESETITYSTPMRGIEGYPLIVALCSTKNGLYALDNGYEFPATKEVIAFAKSLKGKITDANVSLNCGNM